MEMIHRNQIIQVDALAILRAEENILIVELIKLDS